MVEESSDQSEQLKADAELAGELGFDAEYLDSVPLVGRPGVRFANQARIHPRQYLAGVAKAFVALGGRIHEHSEADEFCDSPRAVKANGHTVTCEDVVIATHNPLVGFGGMAGATLFQTKLALYTSYVIAGRVARGVVPDALWWDTADPYQFLRVEPHRDHDVVIFGGEDHKTGQEEDTEACYRRLEEQLRAVVPDVELTHRWSGQVIETPDGLPYIGRSADHQYSATGYAGQWPNVRHARRHHDSNTLNEVDDSTNRRRTRRRTPSPSAPSTSTRLSAVGRGVDRLAAAAPSSAIRQ